MKIKKVAIIGRFFKTYKGAYNYWNKLEKKRRGIHAIMLAKGGYVVFPVPI